MHDSATSVATTTQGYWLNLSDATVSTATDFEDMMVSGGGPGVMPNHG
jgi:hypothetical protein